MKIFDKIRSLTLGLAGLMLLFSAPVSAQNTTEDLVVVTGFVTDAALNTPMPGVRVQAYNNTRYSAMSKADGSFTIRIPVEIWYHHHIGNYMFRIFDCRLPN